MDAEVADLMAGMSGRKPAVLDPTQYQPWPQHQSTFDGAVRTVATAQPTAAAAELSALLAAQQLDADAVRLLPITVRDQRMTAVFAQDSDELLAIIPVAILAR
jgi:hypothetical protein